MLNGQPCCAFFGDLYRNPGTSNTTRSNRSMPTSILLRHMACPHTKYRRQCCYAATERPDQEVTLIRGAGERMLRCGEGRQCSSDAIPYSSQEMGMQSTLDQSGRSCSCSKVGEEACEWERVGLNPSVLLALNFDLLVPRGGQDARRVNLQQRRSFPTGSCVFRYRI